MSIFRDVILGLYRVLEYYFRNPGISIHSAKVIQYFDVWKELHKSTVNISSEGWNAITDTAKGIGLQLSSRKAQEMFLFCIETYLDLLMKLIALNRLGNTIKDIYNFRVLLNRIRGLIPESVLEWYFEAIDDQSLPSNLRTELRATLHIMINSIDYLDFSTVTFDMFREIYQNILPSEIRKSLGEYYTSEEIVNEVLDVSKFVKDEIIKLYNAWKSGNRKVKILDPACGSGTFLIEIMKRIVNVLKGKVTSGTLCKFICENVIGVDINPFAVNMARLNYLIAILTLLPGQLPSHIPIYWADSLARFRTIVMVNGLKKFVISVPSLERLVGTPLEIPDPESFMDAEELLKLMVEFISNKRKFESFYEYLQRNPPRHTVTINLSAYRSTLETLYSTVSRIYESGNARLIEMLANLLKVMSLRGSCSFVLGNPPWVRIHNLGKDIREFLKKNFKFYQKTYNPKFRKTRVPFQQQFDYSMAFVEAGLEYLVENGILAYVITSKITQTTYAGGLRENLMNFTILSIIDYSLYPKELFKGVVNYPLIISIKKRKPLKHHRVHVRIYNTKGAYKDFDIEQYELPLYVNELTSPWVIAPRHIISVLRKLQKSGPRFGDIYEIMMGVKTALNKAYIVKKVLSISSGIAEIEMEDGRKSFVEIELLCPMVRGEDIDPFMFIVKELIIFPHNEKGEVLADPDQSRVLNVIADAIKSKKNIKCYGSGATMVIEVSEGSWSMMNRELREHLIRYGYIVEETAPCVVNKCYSIYNRRGSFVLNMRIEGRKSKCKIYIDRLTIPGKPKGTQHFLKYLSELLKRDDYKLGQPPWIVFRVSEDKLRLKIAWQENSRHFEAALLPSKYTVQIHGTHITNLLIPIQTTYFVIDENILRAAKLALYLNSSIARGFLKLVSWKARGGFFRHISASVGHLPLPDIIRECKWLGREELDEISKISDYNMLNRTLKKIYEKHIGELEKKLATIIGINAKELEAFKEFTEWLNPVPR